MEDATVGVGPGEFCPTLDVELSIPDFEDSFKAGLGVVSFAFVAFIMAYDCASNPAFGTDVTPEVDAPNFVAVAFIIA